MKPQHHYALTLQDFKIRFWKEKKRLLVAGQPLYDAIGAHFYRPIRDKEQYLTWHFSKEKSQLDIFKITRYPKHHMSCYCYAALSGQVVSRLEPQAHFNKPLREVYMAAGLSGCNHIPLMPHERDPHLWLEVMYTQLKELGYFGQTWIDIVDKKKVRRVLHLRARGHSMTAIAKKLGVARKTVYEWLKQWGLPANCKDESMLPVNRLQRAAVVEQSRQQPR